MKKVINYYNNYNGVSWIGHADDDYGNGEDGDLFIDDGEVYTVPTNKNYRRVIIRGTGKLIGRSVRVKISNFLELIDL